MRFTNKVQARECMKLVMDKWIEGYKLSTCLFCIDIDGDSDIAEWTEEEQDNGDAFIAVHNIGVRTPFRDELPEIHVNRIGIISHLLEIPVTLRNWNGESTYYASLDYKNFRFFELLDEEDYIEDKEWFWEENNE